MWVYVPSTSTSSPSAQAAEDSISASNWQFQALAASCSWRGKLSPARNWFQRWKRDSCIRLLFGAMPSPSTACAGVDAWTASLAASRAKGIALQARSAEASTSETSGHRPDASSSKPARGSSSSKTLAACSRRGMTTSLEPKGFGETFASWVLRLREDSSRRRKSARAMNASASSSSAWPTATTNMITGAGSSGRDGGDNLQTAVAMWPTPQTADVNMDRGSQEYAEMKAETSPYPNLAVAAKTWPPTANDWKGSGPTLERKDGMMRGDRLDYATEQLWYTPDVPNGGRSLAPQSTLTGKKADGSKQQVGLENQARVWPTPTSLSFGESHQPGNSKSMNDTLDLASSLRDRLTHPVGEASSKERRSLNPLFVEWLMGWPPGRLDIARVDRLRMLGNGVVPLQAAYAVRTLATRLADRGSAGATRLVRMMEPEA